MGFFRKLFAVGSFGLLSAVATVGLNNFDAKPLKKELPPQEYSLVLQTRNTLDDYWGRGGLHDKTIYTHFLVINEAVNKLVSGEKLSTIEKEDALIALQDFKTTIESQSFKNKYELRKKQLRNEAARDKIARSPMSDKELQNRIEAYDFIFETYDKVYDIFKREYFEHLEK